MEPLRSAKAVVRVTKLETHPDGSIIPVVLHRSKRKGGDRKKRGFQPAERALKTAIDMQRTFAQTLSDEVSAASCKAGGAVTRLPRSVYRAISKGRKQFRLDKLI